MTPNDRQSEGLALILKRECVATATALHGAWKSGITGLCASHYLGFSRHKETRCVIGCVKSMLAYFIVPPRNFTK